MAKYKGILDISGSLGELTFQSTKRGKVVRRKPCVAADRLDKYPLAKKHTTEFGKASTQAKLFRNAFGPAIGNAADYDLPARSVKIMHEVLKSDKLSVYGSRTAALGDTSAFQGFEFNAECPLKSASSLHFRSFIIPESGQFEIQVPAFVPRSVFKKSKGFFQLVAVSAAIDFDGKTMQTAMEHSSIHAINEELTDPIQLTMTIDSSSPVKRFLALGLEIFGTDKGLAPGTKQHRSLKIVAVA